MQRRIYLCCAGLAGLTLLTGAAHAQDFTWDGGGANDRFDNDDNWENGLAPVDTLNDNDDSVDGEITFGDEVNGGNYQVQTFEDYGEIQGITFNGSDGYTLSGEELIFSGADVGAPSILGNAQFNDIINNDISSDEGLDIGTNRGTLEFNGDIEITGGELAFDLDNQTAALVAGEISTDDGLTKEGEGFLFIAGSNSYEGDTTLEEGFLVLSNDDALGDALTSTLVIEGGFINSNDDDRTIDNDITVNDDFGFAGDFDLELTGDVDLSGGNRSISASPNADATFSGNISNGSLTKTGSGFIRLDGENTYTGPTTIEGGGLGGDGSITSDLIANGGSVNLGSNDNVDTFNVNGDVTITDGAAFRVDVNADNDEADTLDVTGDLTFETGSEIVVDRVEDTSDPEGGDEFTIATAGSIDDNAEISVGDGLSGYEITKAIMDGNLMITLTGAFDGGDGGQQPLGPFGMATVNSTNPGLGSALDSLGEDDPLRQTLENDFNDEQLNQFVEEVNKGARTSQITNDIITDANHAFSRTQSGYFAARRVDSPAMVNAGSNIIDQVNRNGSAFEGRPSLASTAVNPELMASVLGAQDARYDDLYDEGVNNSSYDNDDWITPELGGFVKGYGMYSDIDADDDRTGYQADTYGVAAGIDSRISGDAIFGLSFGYNRSDADLADGLGEVESNSFRVGPYVSTNFGQLFLDSSLTFGYHAVETTRSASNIGSVDGDFDAYDVSIYLGGGYDIIYNSGLVLTPTASMLYTYFDREDYTESGDGALDYNDMQTNTFQTRLGGQISYPIDFDSVVLVPEFALGWQAKHGADDNDISAQFATGSERFRIDTAGPEENTAYVGLGLSTLIDRNLSAFVQYDGSFGSDTEIHGLSTGLTFRF